jgi:hypothetical protein
VAVYLGEPPADNFTRVPNDWLRDPKIRGLAKAVLAYLMSHRSGYRLTIKQMATEFKEREDALYAAVKELIAAGYVRRVQRRLPGGVVGEVDFFVIGSDGEFPQTAPLRENPEPVVTCDDTAFPQVATASGFTGSGLPGSGESGSKKTSTKKTRVVEDQKEDHSLSGDAGRSLPAGREPAGERDQQPSATTETQQIRDLLTRHGCTDPDTVINHWNARPGGPRGVGWWLTIDRNGHTPARIADALTEPDPPEEEALRPDVHPFQPGPDGISCARCRFPAANRRHRTTVPAVSRSPRSAV